MGRKGMAASVAIVLLMGCSKVPITGRSQLNLIPESDMETMSLAEYRGFLDSIPPMPASDQRVQMVRRVGQRLAASATTYLNENNAGDRVAGIKWEFNLVDQPVVNAWCMPGGKVVVYTGLLPVTQDEASLALVMGHEISHAIARHGKDGCAVQIHELLGLDSYEHLRNLILYNAEDPGTAESEFGSHLGLKPVNPAKPPPG